MIQSRFGAVIIRYIILTLLVFPLFGQAENWPQFRGPGGDGHSNAKNVPTEWSPEKNVKWKQAVPPGWSSPVLVDDRIYLTAARDNSRDEKPDLDLLAICLEADSGRTVWEKKIFEVKGSEAPRIHRKNSNATPTPTVEKDKLYVHFGHQGTACLDLDGKIVWKTRAITYKPVHGGGCSPIIVDDKLFFSCDGANDPFVVALNKSDGKEAWRTRRTTTPKKSFSFCTPMLLKTDAGRWIISPGSGGLFAYDPASGKEVWKVRYGEGYSVVPKPVFGHGLIFISSGFDQPVLMAVKPGGKGDMTDKSIVWQAEKRAPLTPSMLLVGDELYYLADNGVMTCADARKGDVHWQERVCGGISASPIFAEGRIYVQDEKGLGVVVKAGRTFEVLAKNDLKERALASYAVDDGALYIRTHEHLYRIGDSP